MRSLLVAISILLFSITTVAVTSAQAADEPCCSGSGGKGK